MQQLKKADRSNFGAELSERLRDQFVAGTRNLDLKATLLMLPDLTFQTAVLMCKKLEWLNLVPEKCFRIWCL